MKPKDYTDADVEEFKETDCPFNLCSADNETLKKTMEGMGWKPSRLSKPKIHNTEELRDETSWKTIHKTLGMVECILCKNRIYLSKGQKYPKYCTSCQRITSKDNPLEP